MSRFHNHVEVMPVNELELMVSAGRAARQKKSNPEEYKWTQSIQIRFALNREVSFEIPQFCIFSR